MLQKYKTELKELQAQLGAHNITIGALQNNFDVCTVVLLPLSAIKFTFINLASSQTSHHTAKYRQGHCNQAGSLRLTLAYLS